MSSNVVLAVFDHYWQTFDSKNEQKVTELVTELRLRSWDCLTSKWHLLGFSSLSSLNKNVSLAKTFQSEATSKLKTATLVKGPFSPLTHCAPRLLSSWILCWKKLPNFPKPTSIACSQSNPWDIFHSVAVNTFSCWSFFIFLISFCQYSVYIRKFLSSEDFVTGIHRC